VAKVKAYEDWAYVLDVYIRKEDSSKIAQLLGSKYLAFLECLLNENEEISVLEKVHVGKGERRKISHVLGRISSSELTVNAKKSVEFAVSMAVLDNWSEWIKILDHPAFPKHKIGVLKLRTTNGVAKQLTHELFGETKKLFLGREDWASIPPVIGRTARYWKARGGVGSAKEMGQEYD